ncbi:MAG: hypothetical protein ACXAC7_13710 [Candidatus Hodarchaeales archaeon]
MIFECWFLQFSGLPLWSRQFGQVKHKLDPALIAGLLTATKSFADLTMGSELQDLVLENDRLHSYPVLNNFATFTVHCDLRIELDQIDQILEKTHQKLREAATAEDIEVNALESASFQTLQKFIKLSQPVLEDLADELIALKNMLFVIYDEGEFDQEQLTLLKEVPSIVPFLVDNECSLTIRDLSTQKIHFQQLYSQMDTKKANKIYEILNQMMYLDFMDADLTSSPGFIIIGGTATAIFKIKKVEHNLFITIKDNIDLDQFNQFRKLVHEVKKRVLGFYH